MAHERQEIRDAVVALLVAASTSAGARVFKTRMGPVRSTELPALAVYADSEEVDPASAMTAPRELKRTVHIAIEGWAAATEDLDDALDALALEIEEAMDADLNLDGNAFDSVLIGTEIAIKPDGNRPMGCARLVYSVVYNTDLRVADPEDNFDSADIAYDQEGAQVEDDQAGDLLTDINPPEP